MKKLILTTVLFCILELAGGKLPASIKIGLTEITNKTKIYFVSNSSHPFDLPLPDKIPTKVGNIFVSELELEKREPAVSITNCVFIRDTSILICKGSKDEIECMTDMVWDGSEEERSNFSVYGIGAFDESHLAYKLYPQAINNTGWIDSSHSVDGIKTHISLFTTQSNIYSGFRVQNQQCFNKMVNILAHKFFL